MSHRQIANIPTVSGLRTRYFPKNRIGQGLISISPWIDVVMLVMFFFLLDSQVVLQPGIIIELPRQTFREGTRGAKRLAILHIKGARLSEDRTMIFFDDASYSLRVAKDREKLSAALRVQSRREFADFLVIETDRRVAHGVVADIMELATDAGFKHINLAIIPESR